MKKILPLLLLLVSFLFITQRASASQVQVINSGGDTQSSFAADANYSGGSTYSSSNSVDTSGVSNPAPQGVYQTVRFGNTFTYTLPNLVAHGTYLLRLHFNELYWGTPLSGGAGGAGSRVFTVTVNGAQVLSNFDVFAAAGGANKAIVKEFSATADTNGNISIQFTAVTDNALVNGIELLSADNLTPTPTPTPSLITTAQIADGAITTPKLADGAVDGLKLLDAIISTTKLIDGAVTTSKIADGAITTSKLSTDLVSGWEASDDTWTYASATSFTIAGVDRTSVYSPGTKVKFTNNGSTEYGYVKSSTFSTDTTVNLVANTDYAINNSSIANPYYSYIDNPQGFPSVFNLSLSGISGFASIDGYQFNMQVSGRMVHLQFNIEGHSNAVTLTLSAPIPLSQLDQYPMAIAVSDGTIQSVPGVMGFNTTTGERDVIYVGKAFNSFSGNIYGGFSASGAKGIYGQYMYSF